MRTKTVEEMRAAVLAECERLFEGTVPSDVVNVGDQVQLKAGYEDVNGRDCPAVFLHIDGKRVAALYAYWWDWEIALFYLVLGLETRDAVEAKNAELAESEIAFERQANILQAERALSAKLVEALEDIRKWDGELDYEWGGYKNRASLAITAHKKGASNGN